MLRVLIGSQPVRAGWWAGTTVSTATHGALIALAVVASTTPTSQVEETRAAQPERVTYVATLPAPQPAASQPEVSAAGARGKPSAPNVPADIAPPELSVSLNAVADAIDMPDIAAPDLTAVTGEWLAESDSLARAASSTPSVADLVMAKAGMTAPTDGVYSEEMVERSVEPRRGNPKPRYPSVLQDMGVGGDFVVKFVVDSTGTVKDDDIEFPESMHRLFVDAVRSALRRSRYLPAMFAGRRVPQLVEQEFRFRAPSR